MSLCRYCEKDFPEAKNRNHVAKEFCSDRCRWNFHNSQKLDAFLDEIRVAVEAIMKKHRYIR